MSWLPHRSGASKWLVVVTCLIVASSSCTETQKPPQESIPRRGTLKAILAPLPDPFTLDPQRDYAAEPWGFFRCCLLRTLLSYPGLPTARGGAELRPDLAASLPEVSSDGLTWTFRLKRGLRYGPPLTNTEIHASDIVRALERVARVGGDAYPFYYAVIEGFSEVLSGKAESISSLETPDDHTLVIHLTQPTGDLGYRLALPAAAPIPPVPSGAALGSAEGHEEAFLDIHGGRAIGEVTGHIILNSLENNLLLNYDPYATPGSAGNLDSARQEMALSRYDRDGDGMCDDPVCRNVLAVAAKLEGGVGRKEGEAFASDLKALGISLDLRVLDFGPFFTRLSDPRRHVALGINAGWLKDFPAAGSFVIPLFSRNGLGASNYSLVGATSEDLRSWGYKVTSVPTVEEKVSDCVPLVGDEQIRCYAELDQQIMEQVVPWVPLLVENHVYIVSRRVASTSFDQFTTQPAVDRTALSAGRS